MLPYISKPTGAIRTLEPGLALILDNSATPVLYVGQALPGTATSAASWSIKKIDTTSGIVIKWADGDTLYDNIWDNRASLSYS